MIAPITVSALNEATCLRHAFFTREGGLSQGLYASLNCGTSSADDPALVAANRARAMDYFGLPAEALASVFQRHTDKVYVLDGGWKGGPGGSESPVADALVTRRPGVALGILTADCAPVLLADPAALVIAAAHAGWKGALSGILDNTVAAMIGQGARPDRIVAAIGPSIAMRSYEVGPEFPAPFLAADEEDRIFFAPARRAGHFHFDLPAYVAKRLARLGVTQVTRTPCDTCREENRFFSYRRSVQKAEPDYGRQLSAIMLEGPA